MAHSRARFRFHYRRPEFFGATHLARRKMQGSNPADGTTPVPAMLEELRGLARAAERLWRDLKLGPCAFVPGHVGHSKRVMVFSLTMARFLRLSEERCQRICRAAYLHDVGKTAISSSILRKSGALTRQERAAMQVHPIISRELLGAFLCTEDLAGIVLSHHERYDGQGYPEGLHGADIPLEARILSIADSLDAMLSRHPHANGRSLSLAWDEITREAGRQFDPCVVESLDRDRDAQSLPRLFM